MIHAPGIYFGMSDTEYHDDPALGSTDIKTLLQSAPDYWWRSDMNPAKEPEKETPSKIFGRAVHTCVLEGRSKFEAHYAPKDHNGSTKDGKAEMAAIQAAGKVALKRDDFTRILAASAFIKANEFLSSAFEGGKPEVSVFWEENGIRKKFRADYLKLNAIVDLKSIRNSKGKDFVSACYDAIANYGYDISAAYYTNGRRQMAGLLRDGAVFGDHDPDWLKSVCENQSFAFVLVFWQAEGSPISHGIKISPNHPIFKYAEYWIGKGLAAFKSYQEEFGPDTAWVLNEPLDELDESKMPGWWVFKQNEGK